MTDTCCAEATLETAFRPHEVLFHALDTLEDLGILTLHSDHDVAAARLLAAIDDAGATVTAYEDDEEPLHGIVDEVWPFVIGPVLRVPDEVVNRINERVDAKIAADEEARKAADEVCPFLIPFIKSDPWWKDGETYDLGGLQFTVMRGGK
ncbi:MULTISPECIES: hypothetical protein [Rhodococcus]|uniref:hypothetical protein n=1 Tax=Rhodococcus TaxID=1827 RepID=UPI000B011C1D|nr:MULTISPECIES: hypothetical protein [Rhodococcus]MCE4161652.1 hypothetical protein [Rhodococcus sp. Ni2]